MTEMGIDGITVSPGYAYERAPDQQHFLNRTATKELFRDVFRRGNGGRRWAFNQSGLFLDFLAGNQAYHCTPWGNPTRTVFGWQRPCYLLGEGYAQTFKELMEETDWDAYGTGNYEKCADCMVHSRLRGDRGHGRGAQAAGRRSPSRCAACGPRARWRRRSRSTASARPSSCSHGNVAEKLVEIRDASPNPSSARQCRSASKACFELAREAHQPADLAERRAIAASTATRSISPSGRRRGRRSPAEARSAGSQTTRTAANGRSCPAANAAATCDSMSTAAAPVAARSVLFSSERQGRRVDPGQVAAHHLLECPASRSASSCAVSRCVSQRWRVPTTPVPTTTSPGASAGSSPPAMPKLTTARQPGSMRA